MVLFATLPDEGSSPGDGEGTTDRDVPAETVEQALQHRRRREILRALCDHDGDLPLSTLATQLAAGDSSFPETLAVLHDLHLPKLVETGVVEYAPDSGVTLQVDQERIETELRTVSEDG